MGAALAEPQLTTESDEKPTGLECPACGCRHWYTIETRTQMKYIRRRRQCRHCGRRVTTSERIIGG